jgi:hypothetical protein
MPIVFSIMMIRPRAFVSTSPGRGHLGRQLDARLRDPPGERRQLCLAVAVGVGGEFGADRVAVVGQGGELRGQRVARVAGDHGGLAVVAAR